MTRQSPVEDGWVSASFGSWPAQQCAAWVTTRGLRDEGWHETCRDKSLRMDGVRARALVLPLPEKRVAERTRQPAVMAVFGRVALCSVLGLVYVY
jgi:hypothetical protein